MKPTERPLPVQTADDFRFNAHTLLLALDESTVQIMKLVVASSMGTEEWTEAVDSQKNSFAALHSHLNHPHAAALMLEIFQSA